MRQRNIVKVADTIFWYAIYLLPMIGYLLYVFAICRNPNAITDSGDIPSSFINFGTFMNRIGIHTLTNNVIYSTFNSLFGTSGVVGSFLSGGTISLLSYFCSVFIAHLLVDVILFIPRFAMKWMDEFTKE